MVRSKREYNMVFDTIICGNNVDVMRAFSKDTIDLTVTSPPYNVGYQYDTYSDDLSGKQYFEFVESWLYEVYRVTKSDGRVCINIPYEVNFTTRGGRVFISAEYWVIAKKIGFKWAGIVDLAEKSAHRTKNTAFGSWLSPSAPYIYNPKECVLILYKDNWVKDRKDRTIPKKEFMELVSGEWDYSSGFKFLTDCNFNESLPNNCIKLLTYPNDLVLDPFCGSGTTCKMAILQGRNYIGIDCSEKYCEIARDRIANYDYDMIGKLMRKEGR